MFGFGGGGEGEGVFQRGNIEPGREKEFPRGERKAGALANLTPVGKEQGLARGREPLVKLTWTVKHPRPQKQ